MVLHVQLLCGCVDNIGMCTYSYSTSLHRDRQRAQRLATVRDLMQQRGMEIPQALLNPQPPSVPADGPADAPVDEKPPSADAVGTAAAAPPPAPPAPAAVPLVPPPIPATTEAVNSSVDQAVDGQPSGELPGQSMQGEPMDTTDPAAAQAAHAPAATEDTGGALADAGSLSAAVPMAPLQQPGGTEGPVTMDMEGPAVAMLVPPPAPDMLGGPLGGGAGPLAGGVGPLGMLSPPPPPGMYSTMNKLC